jgi:protein-S-isoprenylcysteine O-methyltransferase Ste14
VTPAPVLVRLGGWLFRQRTWLPLPIAAALIFIPAPAEYAYSTAPFRLAGLALIAAGESLRMWGVHHIGAISRTRSERLGPLISSGPFAMVRNPLYIGNIALWAGFAVFARLLWLLPIIVAVLACEYHAIVRWEEELLASRLGDSYRAYLGRVNRWLPSWSTPSAVASGAMFSWRDTLFSERSTLIAIAAGLVLLFVKTGVESSDLFLYFD